MTDRTLSGEILDTPLFTVAVAAQAALVEPGTLRMWFQRKRIELSPGAAEYEVASLPDKAGLPRLLTLRTVLTLAAAAVLVRKGATITEAHKAAQSWTYGGAFCPKKGFLRPICGLYPSPSRTVLLHFSGPKADVIEVKRRPDGSFAIPFAKLLRDEPVPTAPTIVFLNEVDAYARAICEDSLNHGASRPQVS